MLLSMTVYLVGQVSSTAQTECVARNPVTGFVARMCGRPWPTFDHCGLR